MKKNIILENYSQILSEDELYDQFDDFINQSGEPIKIFDSTFDLSFILKKCDPIQYNYYFERYKDMLKLEDDDEIEECNAGNMCEKPSDTTNVITDDISDIDILLSSFDTNISLGVSDGIYYIKQGIDGYWEEIPVNTEDEAIAYYDNAVIEAKSQTEFEDEDQLNINMKCNRIWESRQHKAIKQSV